jgi:hypothetical protein
MFKIQITLVFILALTYGFSQNNNIKVKKLDINTKLDHFAARVCGDKIFFSHNLTTRRGRAIKDKYDSFLYIMYEAPFSENGEISDPQAVETTETDRVNISSSTLSSDCKYMYFTTNQLEAGTNKLKGVETFNLQIKRAEYVDGIGWTNFETLTFCNPDNNYAHPALSPDGSTLYFISDIKGTKGKSDLYKVSVTDHKTYGEVTKLSDSINSSRTEIFPFVSADNKLYFTSDRRGGKGGLDIYSFDLQSSDENQKPVCLEEPINSRGDDFSFFLNDDLKSGYLSSRRTRGEGGDDLYYFFDY